MQEGDKILTGLDEDHEGKVELELRLLHATGWPAKAYELATIKKGDRREWGDASRRRLIWRLLMKEDYPLLSLLADRLLTQHATVCSVERAWSQVCIVALCSVGCVCCSAAALGQLCNLN